MRSENAVIDFYRSLQPTQFSTLERLQIRQSITNETWETTLEIALLPREAASNQSLLLTFMGVRDLKFVPADWSVLSFGYIEVVAVGDRQWEGVNYHVFESEQDTTFSFLCRDFNAQLVTLYADNGNPAEDIMSAPDRTLSHDEW